MADISLLDKTYNKDNSFHYHLSLQVEPEGLSYCILDIEKKHYIAFQKYIFGKSAALTDFIDKVERCLKEDSMLTTSFNSSSLIYLTQKSTLVPNLFFDEVNLRDYFEFNHPLEELDEIHYNVVSEIDASNVFAIPNYLANLFHDKFKGLTFYHQATPFIRSVLKEFPHPSGVHINLNPGFFDIIIKQENKLRLYNTFLYQNETDLLYYILFTVKQLNLDPLTIPLTICGEMSDRISFQESLSNYIPKLMYLEPVSPGFSNIFERLSRHKYFNLFYLYNCE
ncbi:MAG: DUF3822 family protein [Bacteroidales bacterium]|nr:DUF3822 family protein [Bacteroidales bacterium]